MAFVIEENGDITLHQGDSGLYPITGLPTNENYLCCFEVRNAKRKTMGEQITKYSNYSTYIEFDIPVTLTDLLTVKKDEEYTDYYFTIKICKTNPVREDTLFLNDRYFGDDNVMRVYPKGAEGV